jgi:glycosyltransferase involved in cell wall biosynthesis
MPDTSYQMTHDLDMLDEALRHVGRQELLVLRAAMEAEGRTIKLEETSSGWLNIAAAIVNRCIRAEKYGSQSRESSVPACSILRDKLDERYRVLVGGMVQPTKALPLEAAIGSVYRSILARFPSAAEVDVWKTNLEGGLPFHEFVLLVEASEEALQLASNHGSTDGEFIQQIFEVVFGRCAHPRDIVDWTARLRAGELQRQSVLWALFNLALSEAESLSKGGEEGSCVIMGTARVLRVTDWQRRSEELQAARNVQARRASQSRFQLKRGAPFRVSAIASLYKGAEFIQQFMHNITTQTIFEECCELVIVDADSPDNESAVIARYLSKYPNIQYLRINSRIGIYDAWNIAIRAARGTYITNTNLDDLRRGDSLELQAAVLDNLEFVDVVYQDFYYTLDPTLDASQVAEFGFSSDLPVVTPSTMISINAPHNAPMWRKRLHEELGWFDTRYRSAGDYEFWLRCVAANKTFYKLNDPHVVYYQNPEGMSTRRNGDAVDEVRRVLKKYSPKLLSPNVTSELREFSASVVGSSDPVGSVGRGLNERYGIVQSKLRSLAASSKY